MALLSLGATTPFTYDPKDGSITIVVRDAITALKGKYHRALVWATDAKGRRREATWTFVLPDVGPQLPLQPLPLVQPAAGAPTPGKAGDTPIPTQALPTPAGGAART